MGTRDDDRDRRSDRDPGDELAVGEGPEASDGDAPDRANERPGTRDGSDPGLPVGEVFRSGS
ncbi:MAG TPA: hypothetical protein VLA82_13900 [Actinomycetota bacterium]|nr:hypothetical protein [Actinomycetota bacterium]